jgi:hypothetical protein
MKRANAVIGMIALLCIGGLIGGCSNVNNAESTITEASVKGPFEIIVEVEPIDDSAVSITRKIKYSGDHAIRLSHSSPLISVVAVSAGEEAVHGFDDILLTTELQPGQETNYGDPVRMDAREGETTIAVLAEFMTEEEEAAYSIPFEFEY